MPDTPVSGLPAGSTVAAGDVFVSTQSGATKKPTAAQIAAFVASMLGGGAAGAVPAQFSYATAIPLMVQGGHMAEHTISAATTFTVAASPVDGATCMVRLIADGTNTPDFSAFGKVGSGSWVNTAATVNIVRFFRLASMNYYTVEQAGAGGGAATAFRHFRLNFTKYASSGQIVPDEIATGAFRVCEFQIMVGATAHPTSVMTNYNAPSPLVASASTDQAGFEAWRVFDGDLSDSGRWITGGSGATPLWLAIDLGAGNAIIPTAYKFGPDGGHGLGNFAIAWTFEGSNAGTFTGEQTVLDTRTGALGIDWNGNTLNTFTLP